LDPREKWLIFTCGNRTYTPHQIGFKRIKPMKFKGIIDVGPSIRERIEAYKNRRALELAGDDEPEVDWQDYDKVADKFDKVSS
jgi:F-box/WD-40 domain protein 5